MDTAKRDISDVWNKLKQTQSGSQSGSFDKLWHGFSSDILSNKASRPAAMSSRGELEFYLQKVINPRQTQANTIKTQPSSAELSFSLGHVALDRLLTSLSSPEASTRRSALQQIKAIYAPDGEPSPAETNASAAAAAEAFTSKLGKSLLRRFDDSIEMCREMAVTTFRCMLQTGPDATLSMLPYAMPVLEERLHFDEATRAPTEPSEEVRLLLVRLLSIVLQQAGTAVAAYASEVWSMLSAALADHHHEVALQGCKVAQQLAGLLGLRLGSMSKDVVAALLPLTTHKRHRVRIAAVEAVRDVMHQGAHEMILEMVAWRDPNMVPIKAFYGDDLKVNYCGKLATDHHVQVRLAFLQMVGNWMLTLRERIDHEARLLPYLLSGLCDESPVVVQAALQLLDLLGQQYEKEHEKDLQDAVRFADAAADASEARFLAALREGTAVYSPEAAAAAAAPSATGTESPGAAGGHSTGPADIGAAAPAVFQLPGPFTSRPRLGARLLVRNNFGSSLAALCGDLCSWQSGPRAMSAALLAVNLAVAESAAERHLQVLLPALCNSIRDATAAESVANCAALLGCHCDLALILDLLTPRLTESVDADARKRADVLLVLAAALRGAGPLRRVQGHSQRLLELLRQPGIADSQDTSIKVAATAVMQQLLRPGVVQQLLADTADAHQQQQQQLNARDGSKASEVHTSVSSRSSSGSSNRVSNTFAIPCVHVLLQLAACEAPVLGPTAAAGSTAAAAQAQIIEMLLEQLAAAAGYCGVDQLLGVCRQQLLNQVAEQLDLHSVAAVTVACRLLLPSACSWVLTASAAATARRREPINTSYNHDWLFGSSKHCCNSAGAPPGAADGCRPEHMLTLLELVDGAEQTYSQHAQHTPASVHLLQLTLDCCMALWPVSAFDERVLHQLVLVTIPALLDSSHSLAAMTGLRALHHAVLRGLLGSVEASEGTADDAGDAEQQGKLQTGRQMLLQAWQHSQGLCHSVCRLLQSDVSAVRLEVCFLVQSVIGVLGDQILLQHEIGQQEAVVTQAAPQPAAALSAALEDANADVRAAARGALQQLVAQVSQRSTAAPWEAWLQNIQQQISTGI